MLAFLLSDEFICRCDDKETLSLTAGYAVLK